MVRSNFESSSKFLAPSHPKNIASISNETIAMRIESKETFYFVVLNEEQAGPYTIGQLRSMWQSGAVTAHTLFWHEGEEGWQPLIQVRALLENAPVSAAADVPVAPKQPIPNLESKEAIAPTISKTAKHIIYGALVVFVIIMGLFYKSLKDDEEAAAEATRMARASREASNEIAAKIIDAQIGRSGRSK